MSAGGNWAIVVAAGRGTRMGLDYNKVYHKLGGQSVLSRCLNQLSDSGAFLGVVLVISESDLDLYRELVASEGEHELVKAVAMGGDSRQASVHNGLMHVPDDAEVIAVHDAARAFVPCDVIFATIESARAYGSGVAATVVSDTLKRVDASDMALETLDRQVVRAVQTPQVFKAELLRHAHEMAVSDGFVSTDDAALVEKYVGPVRLCCMDSGKRNVKLTTLEDLRNMENQLVRLPHIGQGYDVHRLVPDRDTVLCGVKVPYELGLLGHSDADVATHALMDALLGACGLGDIGKHFPDSDMRYKGVSSIELLKVVMGLIRDAGAEVVNCDITIVCEQPKIKPHVAEMKQLLAGVMGIQERNINIKGTTTEKLGFAGRGEGIEAHAVALVLMS